MGIEEILIASSCSSNGDNLWECEPLWPEHCLFYTIPLMTRSSWTETCLCLSFFWLKKKVLTLQQVYSYVLMLPGSTYADACSCQRLYKATAISSLCDKHVL